MKQYNMMLATSFLFTAVYILYSTVDANQASSGFYRQFRHGDILIGGAIEIHRHAGIEMCGELRSKGVQDVELINMLIEKINRNDSILKGIKLGSVLIDTCAWPTHALSRVFTDILPFISYNPDKGNDSCNRASTDPKPILAGILGPGTSKVALQLANQLQVFSIPQVSHSATLQELSDKTLYSYFFRTVPPDIYEIRAMIDLATNMNWNYVSIVFENDCLGRNAFLEFSLSIKNRNVCVDQAIAIPKLANDQDYVETVLKLSKKNGAKAVLIYTRSIAAEKIISATQKSFNNSNKIVWIASDGWARYLPLNQEDDSYVDELEGSVAFSAYGMHLKEVDEYMTNITLEQRQDKNFDIDPWFSELLAIKNKCSLGNGSIDRKCKNDERLNKDSFRSTQGMLNLENAFMSYVYALEAYHRDKCQGQEGMCPAMRASYGNNKLASELRMYLQNVSFVDRSQRLFFFDKNQDGPISYHINTFVKDNIKDPKQQRQGWEVVGSYTNEIIWNHKPEKANNTESVCSKPCGIGYATIVELKQKCCWTCHLCNKAQFVSPNTQYCETCPLYKISNKERNGCQMLTIFTMEYHDVHSIICLVVGCLGIVCTFIVIGIYTKNRKSAIVRASGGELCFVVLLGVLLTFCNCFAFGAPATTATCFASRFVLSMGPTIMHAALLVKTTRVVIIFKYKTDIPPKLKSAMLPMPQICIIFAIVVFEAVIAIMWIIVYPCTPTIYVNDDKLFLTCPGVTNNIIFVGLAFPFILMVICTVFATVNRKVPAGFNETLFIGLTMYTSCVIWLAFLPLFLVNDKNMSLKMTTTSVCLSCSALTVLLCVFVPRCYTILFCPEENNHNAIMSPSTRLNEHSIHVTIQSEGRV